MGRRYIIDTPGWLWVGLIMYFLQVLQAQVDKDAKMQELWEKVQDILGFVDDAEPLKVISGVKKTITAIMNQITECARLFQNYNERSKTCKCTIVLASDNTQSS